MGGINFGWMAVWVLSPEKLCRKLEVCDGETAEPVGGECGPCLDFASYTLAFALQLRKKHGKPSVRVTEGRSPDQQRTPFVKSTWPLLPTASTGLLSPTALGLRARQRGQHSVTVSAELPYKGVPTLANFESKLSVSAVMWSANIGTPRPSCICLLITYQEEPIARRRHLDCNTCSFRTWLWAADFHAGHA